MKRTGVEEEEILVGTALVYPEIYPEAATVIRPKDFVDQRAMRAWVLIGEQLAAGEEDLQGRVAMAMGSHGDFLWVVDITGEIIPMRSTAVSVARAIADRAKRRRLAAELRAIANKAGEALHADRVLEDMMSAYRREAGETNVDARIKPVVDRFRQVQEANRRAGRLGMRTGFRLLQNDYITYQRGHLWVIGAWTSVGKSAFMIEAVTRFLRENESGRALIFSTEMKEEQNVARLLANKTGVNANVILSGDMLDMHARQVNESAAWLSGTNLSIHDQLRNIDDVMAQCRKAAFIGGIDLIFIDFIQNVFRPGEPSQYAMMSQIAKDLQNLAHDLNCTIVCLSQLPNHAGREDTGILEFKGAGEIAAACDVGVLMKRAKEDKTKILFDVRKNRHGKCGKYLLQFVDGWTRIEEVEPIE